MTDHLQLEYLASPVKLSPPKSINSQVEADPRTRRWSWSAQYRLSSQWCRESSGDRLPRGGVSEEYGVQSGHQYGGRCTRLCGSSCEPRRKRMRGFADRKGHVWGGDVKPLRQLLIEPSGSQDLNHQDYDLLLLSDLVFNHSQVSRPLFPACNANPTASGPNSHCQLPFGTNTAISAL